MEETLNDMYQKLLQAIQRYKRVIVAYSGGVDSSLVLKACVDALGKDNVLAVIASSQLDERDVSKEASEQAQAIGSPWRIVKINELSHEKIVHYSPDSWYYSKMMLYENLENIRIKENYDVIMDGMIMNDTSDFRPGLLARDHSNVVSVLQEQGVYKDEVRSLLKMLEQNVWSKPTSCSLLSRFSYGDIINQEKLERIRNGEHYLRSLGFEINRVRIHDNLARIEVDKRRLVDIMDRSAQIQHEFNDLGFTFVCVDLKGYQSGRMNEELSEEVMRKYQS